MDDHIRNQIDNFVRDSRNLLKKDISEQLEGIYGLHKDGTFEDLDSLPQIKDDPKAQLAREGFVYFINNEISQKQSKKDAIRHLVLALSFTHLNRLIALKLMESRKVIPETISRGTNSNGFKLFLGDFPDQDALKNDGKIEEAYKNYLLYQYQNISEEIHSLFDPDDISNLVFPKPKTLFNVLDLVNQESLNEIWIEDETIGWIYQYFTPKDRRKKMRKDNPTPKNSHELAVRNQFYTPRYVVRFLTDNTLGRIWYEMRKGDTKLAQSCEFMVRRPKEIFLAEGQDSPNQPEKLNEEDPEKALNEPFYIPFRAKKDPREIRVLDPAVGSGHFLLYSFDILSIIYEEAYADPDLCNAFKEEYSDLNEFKKAIPALILRHNLHGIDIDPRAVQIATLALWLRAQRTYQDLGLRRNDRPKISKSNIVCAESMPGDKEMLEEYKAQVKPAVLGNLVEKIWQEMQLAGEAGSLLKIEQEISQSIQDAKDAWMARPKDVQQDIDGKKKYGQVKFDFTGIKKEIFWDEAEELLLESLHDFSEQASNGQGYSRRLFADDAAQGFAFIDLMRKQYDVVLMNPPFGEATDKTKPKFKLWYPDWNKNYLCAFIDRAQQIIHEKGSVGVIFDRTAIVKSTYENFRKNVILNRNSLYSMADTGWEVLDAYVETTTLILQKNNWNHKNIQSIFFDLRKIEPIQKGDELKRYITKLRECGLYDDVYIKNPNNFRNLPNQIFGYDIPSIIIKNFIKYPSLKDEMAIAVKGHDIKSDQYQRYFWEIPLKLIQEKKYSLFFNGGSYSKYYLPSIQVIPLDLKYDELKQHPQCLYRNERFQKEIGIGFGKRGDYIDLQILRPNHFFSAEGNACFPKDYHKLWYLLGLLNSSLNQITINFYCGLHKSSSYVNLIPVPSITDPEKERKISEYTRDCYFIKYNWYFGDETNYQFIKPWFFDVIVNIDEIIDLENILNQLINYEKRYQIKLNEFEDIIDKICFDIYKIQKNEDIEKIKKYIDFCPNDNIWMDKRNYSDSNKKFTHIESIISYWIGCIFGRWDIINGGFYDDAIIQNGEVFDLKEIIQKKIEDIEEKGIIVSEPIKSILSTDEIQNCDKIDYPPIIDSDGIIPLDEGHPNDLIKQIFKTVSFTFKEFGNENALLEIEEIIGNNLRKYFEKSFFKNHCARYLNRPIYWQLTSLKGNYSIWLYYHRITRDTLFIALNDYIIPKIELEEGKYSELKQRIERDKDFLSQRQLIKLGKEIESKVDFIDELKDFKEKIEKVVHQGYEPDFDDGVILNMAPLHEVIPWKEPKSYWEDLENGKYDWAHIAMKYWPERVKEKCKKDKSIAIAHGLEHLYEAD